ncbi:MAG: pyruvate kinase [Spirochaetaceae bacterium]
MKRLRKTKIICTLGPAVDDVQRMKELLEAGMNVARFNFSHGNHEEQYRRLEMIRRASRETDIPAGLLLDTKGPEIRTGVMADDAKVRLEPEDRITLTTEEVEGHAGRVSVSYHELPEHVEAGRHIFVADGLIDLEVEAVEGTEVRCIVRSGGTLGSRKNVNIPGVRVTLPAITDKDKEDIDFAIRHDLDFIAASFVRKANDVLEIQRLLQQRGSRIHVIAKIEDQEGLDNIRDIARVSAGVMIARGDLGVQLSTEQIPLAQKRIIEICNGRNKPVITATQMLDSMINNSYPTRAELTDVANAIFDGTDAVMLSGETAGGAYPRRATETMHRIAMAVEESPEYERRREKYFTFHESQADVGHAIARAAYVVARDIEARAIVAPTLRGNTPRLLSKFRPNADIIAVTTSEPVFRQLLLPWGIVPVLSEHVTDSELMIQRALQRSLQSGYVSRSDKVVTAAGIPVNSPFPMNTIKVHFLGNVLNRGHKGAGESCSGRIVKATSASEAARVLRGSGDEILLIPTLEPEHRDVLKSVLGVIVEGEMFLSPEEALETNPELVVIAEVPEAVAQFENSQIVSLDGAEKIIYEGLL